MSNELKTNDYSAINLGPPREYELWTVNEIGVTLYRFNLKSYPLMCSLPMNKMKSWDQVEQVILKIRIYNIFQ